MVGRNTATQATKGGGAPGGRPVLTATLGPKSPATEAEVESIFASLAELFDEPSPARPALLHEEIFGKAATRTGTRPRVPPPLIKRVRPRALPKANEDDQDLDQSQTVRIEFPVIPAQALRSSPPAPPPARAEASRAEPARPQPVAPAPSVAKAGPPPLPVSALPAIPALPKVLVPPRPAPGAHAASPEDVEVTLISAQPSTSMLKASARPTPPIVVIAPVGAAIAPAAQPLRATVPSAPRASAAPSKATAEPATIRRPRHRAWIAVAAAMGVVVLSFAGWQGVRALHPAATPMSSPDSVSEPAPVYESAPVEPTLLVADDAPVASPLPAEPVAPQPQRPRPVAEPVAHGQIHSRAWSGAPAWAVRKTVARPAPWPAPPPAAPAPTPAPTPSVTPKAAPHVSGPLIPLEEDPR